MSLQDYMLLTIYFTSRLTNQCFHGSVTTSCSSYTIICNEFW